MKNNVWAIIPARSGSKGIKNKNIQKIGKHPLLAWAVVAALKSKYIDRVIVSTDSSRYANIAKNYGAEVPFLRSKKYAKDNSTDYDLINELIKNLQIYSKPPKKIAYIRPTTPFRNPNCIDKAILHFNSKRKYTSLRSVHEMSETAYKTFEISKSQKLVPIKTDITSYANINKPRQSFPKTYSANGYIDIFKTEFLIKSKDIYGTKILPYITQPVIEIDSISDLSFAKLMLSGKNQVQNKLFNK